MPVLLTAARRPRCARHNGSTAHDTSIARRYPAARGHPARRLSRQYSRSLSVPFDIVSRPSTYPPIPVLCHSARPARPAGPAWGAVSQGAAELVTRHPPPRNSRPRRPPDGPSLAASLVPRRRTQRARAAAPPQRRRCPGPRLEAAASCDRGAPPPPQNAASKCTGRLSSVRRLSSTSVPVRTNAGTLTSLTACPSPPTTSDTPYSCWLPTK